MKNHEHLLFAGKDLKLLKWIGMELESEFVVHYTQEVEEVKMILANELLLSLIVVDTDDFDADFEIAEFVKKYPRLASLPVVALGRDNQDIELKYLQLGATDFIKKPLKKEIVVNRIRSIYRIYKCHAHNELFEKDMLTGVYNKEFFLNEAKYILDKNTDIDYDLVCFDIDRFKIINDLYGTAGGDKLLQYIAKIYLDAALLHHWIIGRLHNDVFVILMERGSMDYDELTHLFAHHVESFNIKLVLSFGIYPITDRSLPVSVMCNRALMTSKSMKGNYQTSYTIYQESLRQNIIEQQSMINEMENSLLKGEFVPFYQPKYHIETGHIIGFEALVRWVHPTKGIIPPSEFIPLFEANGFISKVDFYIWEEVCKDLQKLMKKGYQVVPVSVNVSRIELYLNIEEHLLSLLERYEVPVSLLRLEITETAYTQDPKQLIDVVERLRSHGFRILMDDFGSGYSSLNMLKEVPVDVLKVDLKFLQDLQTSGKSEKILESVVIMARKLNLSVIAEGVETNKQVHFLKSIGCLRAQGYYYSRPVNQETMFQLYENPHILMGDIKDRIESIINVEDLLTQIYQVNDVEWYRSAFLKLDAQIFEYDFKTDSMRYYDSRISPTNGKLSKIEVPNYIQRIQEGYHIHPHDIHIALDLLSGRKEVKCRLRAHPYFSNEGYQWYEAVARTIYDENLPKVAVGVIRNITNEKLNEMVLKALLMIDAQKGIHLSVREIWKDIAQGLCFDMAYSVIRTNNQPCVDIYYQDNKNLILPKHLTPFSSEQMNAMKKEYEVHQGILCLNNEDIHHPLVQDYIYPGIKSICCIPRLINHEYIGDIVFVSSQKRKLTENEKAVFIEVNKYIEAFMNIQYYAKELQDKNELYDLIMNNSFGGVLLLTITNHRMIGKIANISFYQLFELDRNIPIEEIVIEDLFQHLEQEKLMRAIELSIVKNQPIIETLHGKKQDGTYLTLEIKIQALTQDRSQIVLTINDISERIQHIQELKVSELRYRLAFEQTSLRLWDYNIKTKQLYRSQMVQDEDGLAQIVDNVPEIFIEKNIIHPDYQKGYLDFYKKISDGIDCDYLFKSLRKNGVYKWMHISYQVLFDEFGHPDHAIGVGEDVNEVYENKLKIQREKYYESLFHNSRIYYDINLTHNSIIFNKQDIFDNIHDYSYSAFLQYVTIEVVDEQDQERFEKEFSIENLKEYYRNGHTFLSYEFELGTQNKRWYEIDVNLYSPNDSEDICAFATLRDIDERKRYELSLEFKVRHDELTGVYTREVIRNYVENIVNHQKIAIMMIDVDDFKLINDTFGHAYGDETLRNIADVLIQVAGDNGIVGRMGGDEFIIIVDRFNDSQDIVKMAQRINDNIHLSYFVNNQKYDLSCSIGITYSQGEHDFDMLYTKADENQYQMKKYKKQK